MVLVPDAPQGLCPICLLKCALEPMWRTGAATDQFAETGDAPPAPAELAAHFPDLDLLEVIGRGGMSMVYKARQKRLNRLVALKVIAPQIAQDPAYIARFRAEATAAARLNHPHIVQIYSEGEFEGTHYLVEEFVEGESLRRRLDRCGRMDPQEALAVCVHIAEALDYAWREARLIHRDIKPDNILLSDKGEVKLSDLGLAKTVDGKAVDLTRCGMTVGTPNYISPEQARADKDIDFRSDIYSLGCTLYHLLSGQRPYHLASGESPIAVVIRQINEPPPPIRRVLPDCPMPVVVVLNKMLAKHPGDRHQSYQELIEELRHAQDAVAQGTAVRQQTATPTPRKRWLVVIGGIAAVIAVAALLVSTPWKDRASKGGMSKTPAANSVTTGTPVPPLSPDGFRALFNGDDLTGWVPMQTTGQKKDVHLPAAGGWTVQNGELLCSTTRSGWLKLEGQYGDFVLQLEFKLEPDCNSGVHIRCPNSGLLSRVGMEIQIIDEHVISARGYRSRPGQLTGGIYGIAGSGQPPQRPAGEWNAMEIRCEGDKVEVTLNGVRSVSANMNEYPELRSRPRSGCVGLSNWQGEAKGTAFRNIRIRELSAK